MASGPEVVRADIRGAAPWTGAPSEGVEDADPSQVHLHVRVLDRVRPR